MRFSIATSAVALLQLAVGAAIPNDYEDESQSEAPIVPTHTYILPTISYSPLVKSDKFVTLSTHINTVLSNAIDITAHSWEYGTLTQALLEVYNDNLTPYKWNPLAFTSGSTLLVDIVANITAGVVAQYDWSGAPNARSAKSLGTYLSATPPVALRPQPLVDGAGSLGDPASVGPAAWLLANFVDRLRVNKQLKSQISSDAYAWATANQLQYLRQGPKDGRGTISQRENTFELWSDMGFMISPFLAYLGLTTNATQLLDEALTQWTDVSDAMLRTDTNLYIHVNTWDQKFWATGNGWMLAGLMRVLASIRAAGVAQTPAFANRVATAENIAALVFKSLFAQLGYDGRLPNYMLQNDRSLAVADSTGTAAVVGAFYRFYVMRPDLATPMLQFASKAFDGVVDRIDRQSWLTEVVDPSGQNGFVVTPGSNLRSPEGQSLLAMMWAARNDAGI